jgi:transcriptional regulator
MTGAAGTRVTRAYPPAAFRETRTEVLADFIRRNPFGQLVTAGPAGLHACGVPFVLEDAGGRLTLAAHLARSNPQVAAGGAEALVLFQGPDAYVRPGWYATKRRDGRAVPTWDYISVQARGRLSVLGDQGALRAHLEALSAQQEGVFDDPWSPADPPPGYVDQLTGGIVGVRLEIIALEGVWKLSQNHPQENRDGVVRGLTELDSPGARAIARAIVQREEEG